MEKKRFKMKKPVIIAASIAAAAALTASVGAVSFGLLSEMFTKYFGDSATKQLADEGYIYTAENFAEDNGSDGTDKLYPVMGETLEKGIFTAKILGIAGDTQDPMMLIDITVSDPEVTAANDVIGVYTQAIGTYEFENKRDSYAITYSKGVKDEEDPSLYHVSARVPPYWVTQGEEVVFDIVRIHTLANDESDTAHSDEELAEFGLNTEGTLVKHYVLDEEIADFGAVGMSYYDFFGMLKTYDVDMQFRFTLPENVLKEAPRSWYDLSEGLVYEADGTEFILTYGEFGAHSSVFSLSCGIREELEDYLKISGMERARKFAEQFVLTVDGTEYTPDLEQAFTTRDTKGWGDLMIENMCYLHLVFPPVDYENAQSITLSANGVSYEVKP
ncbi:MAG: hypothetical protein IJT87_07715 [Ruminiclostridium sp.]|nr:hypothetical protein [Ruminiclostridium sp.]